MSAHTPTPWRIEGATLIWSPTGAATVAACGAPRSSNCVEYRPAYVSSRRDFDEACANAARIVHCVNNFDALVSALRSLCNCMDECLPYVHRPNTAADHAWNMTVAARAALADYDEAQS